MTGPVATAGPQAVGGAWIGARERQEDGYEIIRSGDVLWIVLCDGMGGHAGGEVASRLAVQAAARVISSGASTSVADCLRKALGAANKAIGDRARSDPTLEGMGCTFVTVAVGPGRASWISVGDSPMWLFDGKTLRRLNADHSIKTTLAEEVQAGRMTAEEAARHPQRNALTSAVMGRDISLYDEKEVSFVRGERILLASDGVETLAPGEIAALFRKHAGGPSEKLRDAVMQGVRNAGKPRQDNTTLVVIDPSGAPRPVALFPALSAGKAVLTGGALAVIIAAVAAAWIWSGPGPVPPAPSKTAGAGAPTTGSASPAPQDSRPASPSAQGRPVCQLTRGRIDGEGGLREACACIAGGGEAQDPLPTVVSQELRDDYQYCRENGGALPERKNLDEEALKPAPDPVLRQKPAAKPKPAAPHQPAEVPSASAPQEAAPPIVRPGTETPVAVDPQDGSGAEDGSESGAGTGAEAGGETPGGTPDVDAADDAAAASDDEPPEENGVEEAPDGGTPSPRQLERRETPGSTAE